MSASRGSPTSSACAVLRLRRLLVLRADRDADPAHRAVPDAGDAHGATRVEVRGGQRPLLRRDDAQATPADLLAGQLRGRPTATTSTRTATCRCGRPPRWPPIGAAAGSTSTTTRSRLDAVSGQFPIGAFGSELNSTTCEDPSVASTGRRTQPSSGAADESAIRRGRRAHLGGFGVHSGAHQMRLHQPEWPGIRHVWPPRPMKRLPEYRARTAECPPQAS